MSNLYKYIFLPVRNVFYDALIILFFFTIAIGMLSCTDMDDVYNDFWKDGEKIYPAFADSVKVHPGKNRIQLTWLNIGDPNVSSATVYWNHKTDSIEVPIEFTGGIDTVKVILADMPEGVYAFDIYTYDDEGNSSLGVSTIGMVYGDTYNKLLLNRTMNKALFIDETLEISWGSGMDETSIGTELAYKDLFGATRYIYEARDAGTRVLEDYDFDGNEGFIHFRTMYMPETTAIDTFYTSYDTVKVVGPPVPYLRTGWTVTSSSFRAANPPENVIDGDAGTYWWTADGATFPYMIEVDMGEEKTPVDGIFYQQTPRAIIKNLELQISSDGIEWKSLGSFDLSDNRDMQYFDFMNSESFRYFKIISNTIYGDKSNASIAEVGIFYR